MPRERKRKAIIWIKGLYLNHVGTKGAGKGEGRGSQFLKINYVIAGKVSALGGQNSEKMAT